MTPFREMKWFFSKILVQSQVSFVAMLVVIFKRHMFIFLWFLSEMWNSSMWIFCAFARIWIRMYVCSKGNVERPSKCHSNIIQIESKLAMHEMGFCARYDKDNLRFWLILITFLSIIKSFTKHKRWTNILSKTKLDDYFWLMHARFLRMASLCNSKLEY